MAWKLLIRLALVILSTKINFRNPNISGKPRCPLALGFLLPRRFLITKHFNCCSVKANVLMAAMIVRLFSSDY